VTALVLIRHGETDWNVEARYQGQANPPLNEQGIAQAHQLADSLVDVGIDVIYSSPLQRALQTAQLLARHLEIPLREEPRLMEINQGEWQGLLRSEIEERYPEHFRWWLTVPWSVTPPGGESLEQVQARVDAALDDIVRRHPEECVGLVAHRIPIALIKMRYQGQDPDIVRTLDLPNAYWEEIRDLER
jgi:broad specificity phosphatase PhoE